MTSGRGIELKLNTFNRASREGAKAITIDLRSSFLREYFPDEVTRNQGLCGRITLIESGVDRRPNGNYPSHPKNPENGRENKHHQGFQNPALNELAEARNEEASECSDNVSSRTRGCHDEVSC